ncbi:MULTISPECIES: MurR/RpiR family transcriptional regulator [Pimelobacter]|nr:MULTISPECIES: MurR/RpiR family transcriptional regulator [Pimelobacter]MBU2695438.1 hypothetical protein [Pimelobacter sp. 30-1]UUW91187.1 MurR/RpiR family transcriptional regulator [Pimelobacter simplex]UUW95015.1 MurR/RpiR family transcriptional regulator [Pimelobacter simplex]
MSQKSGTDAASSAARRQWLASLLGGRDFSPKQLAVARFIEGNVYAAETRTASEVAELAEVNVATVVRFAQSLGFSGWPAFQAELRSQDRSHQLPTEIARRQLGDENPFEATLQADITSLSTALETVDQDQLRATAELIAGARRTVVVSAGSYSAVGQILAFNASLMGFPVTVAPQGGPELAVALAGLDESDCAVGISFWRLGRQVVSAMDTLQERGVPTVVMSDSLLSPFARRARHTVVVPTVGASIFQSLTAPVSVTYALLAMLWELAGDGRAERTLHSIEEMYGALGVLDR